MPCIWRRSIYTVRLNPSLKSENLSDSKMRCNRCFYHVQGLRYPPAQLPPTKAVLISGRDICAVLIRPCFKDGFRGRAGRSGTRSRPFGLLGASNRAISRKRRGCLLPTSYLYHSMICLLRQCAFRMLPPMSNLNRPEIVTIRPSASAAQCMLWLSSANHSRQLIDLLREVPGCWFISWHTLS